MQLTWIIALIFATILEFTNSLSIVSYDPVPGVNNVAFDTKILSFTFSETVVPNSGFVHLYVLESEDKWLASLSVPIDGDQVTIEDGVTVKIQFVISPFRFYSTHYYVEIDPFTFVQMPEFIPFEGLVVDSTVSLRTAWYFQVDPPPDVIPPALIDTSDRGLNPPSTIKDLSPIPITIMQNLFTIQFDEPIATGSGRIHFVHYEDQKIISSLPANDLDYVSINDTIVQFAFPNIQMNYSTWYEVVVDPDAISDTAGVGSEARSDESPNFFSGLQGLDTGWLVLVEKEPDVINPYVSTYDVPRPGENVTINWQTFEFNISEPVEKSSAGRILFFESNHGSSEGVDDDTRIYSIRGDKEAIELNWNYNFKNEPISATAYVTIPAYIINSFDSKYYILLEEGTFIDLSGNPLDALTDPTVWTFNSETAPDTRPPQIQTVFPSSRNISIPLKWSATFQLTTDERCTFPEVTPSDTVVFTVMKTLSEEVIHVILYSDVKLTSYSYSETVIEIEIPSDVFLDYATWYSIVLNENVLFDEEGNPLTGIPSSDLDTVGEKYNKIFPDNAWVIRTEPVPDVAGPTLKSSYPPLGNITHPTDRLKLPIYSLSLDFSEEVKLGNGLIKLINSKTGVIVAQTNTGDEFTWVSIINNSTVISLPVPLTQYDTNYHITIEATCITDTSGNGFDGFYDVTQWVLFKKFGQWSFRTQLEPKVLLSRASLQIAELIYGEYYELSLSVQPDLDVIVVVSTAGTATSTLSSGETVYTGATVDTDTFVFTSSNWNVPQTVYIYASYDYIEEGTHYDTIRHEIQTTDVSYISRFVPDINVEIIETDETEPPPKLLTVQFEDNGGKLIATFSSNTDGAGLTSISPCSELWDIGYSDVEEATQTNQGFLGYNAECFWIDADNYSTMNIILGTAANIVPGNIIQLLDDVLRANTVSQFYSKGQQVTVSAPKNPLIPSAYLQAPSTIGKCDDLVVYAWADGSGGREIQYKWLLLRDDPPYIISEEMEAQWEILSNYITNEVNEGLGMSTIQLNSTLLHFIYEYEIQLTAINFLQISSQTITHKFSKSEFPKPEVSIDGGITLRTHKKSEMLKILAFAHSPNCTNGVSSDMDMNIDGVGNSNTMLVEWSQDSTDVYLVDVYQGLSNNKRILQILPHGLEVGSQYNFKFKAFMESDETIFNEMYISVLVVPSPVQVRIRGATLFTRSSNETVTIDGSSSIDPDLNSSPWWWVWSCVDVSDIEQETPCYSDTDEVISSYPSESQLLLPSESLKSNRIYRFTLQAGKADDNYGEASVELNYVSGFPPNIDLNLLSDGQGGADKVNPSTKTTIKGIVTSKRSTDQLDLQWEVIHGDINLNDTSKILSNLKRESLVIAPFSLLPGATYRFRLSVGDGEGTAFASIDIKANKPPSNGFLRVEPMSGYTKETEFTLTASQWIDDVDDFPLKYLFSVIVEGDRPRSISNTQLGTTLETTLPAGLKDLDYNIICQVSVFDRMEAVSYAYVHNVEVAAPQINAQEAVDLVQNEMASVLSDKLAQGDPVSILNSIAELTGLLNAVSDTSVDTSVSSETSVIETTATAMSSTTVPSPKCESDVTCSGNGECVEQEPGTCVDELPPCYICQCSKDWFGDKCDMDRDLYEQRVSARKELLNAVSSAMNVSESSTIAVDQLAYSVNALTSTTDTLDSEATTSAMNLLSNLANMTVNTGVSEDTGALVGEIASNLIQAQTSLQVTALATNSNTTSSSEQYNSTMTGSNSIEISSNNLNSEAIDSVAQMEATLSTVLDAMIANNVPGENAVLVNSKNLKLTAKKENIQELSSAPLVLPSSSSDAAAGANNNPIDSIPSSFQLPSNIGSITSESTISLKAMKWSKSLLVPQSTTMGSSVTSLTLSVGSSEIPVKNLTEPIVIVLPRDSHTINLPSLEERRRGYICGPNEVGNVTITPPCPFGVNLTVICVGQVDEYDVYCPAASPVPACTFFDEEKQIWSNEGCIVANYTSEYTICHCNHLTNFGTELSLVLSDAETVLSSIKRITPEKIIKSLTVIITLIGLYGFFIFACFWGKSKDLRESKKKKVLIAANYDKMLVSLGKKSEQCVKPGSDNECNNSNNNNNDDDNNNNDNNNNMSSDIENPNQVNNDLRHACLLCSGTGTLYRDENDENSPLVECRMCFGSGVEFACIPCKGSGFVNLSKEEKIELRHKTKSQNNFVTSLTRINENNSKDKKNNNNILPDNLIDQTVNVPEEVESDIEPPLSPKVLRRKGPQTLGESDGSIASKTRSSTSLLGEGVGRSRKTLLSTDSHLSLLDGVAGKKACIACRSTGRTNTCYRCLGTGIDALRVEECHECCGSGNRPNICILLTRKFWHTIKLTHPWLSIYFCHDITYTRPQRLTVLLCIIMADMFVNAFLYRRLEESNPSPNDREFDLVDMVGFGIVTAIITLPVSVLFVLMFKRAQAAKNSTFKLLEAELLESRNKKPEEIISLDKEKLHKKMKKVQGKCEQRPYAVAYMADYWFAQKVRTRPVDNGGTSPVFTDDHNHHMEVDYPGSTDADANPTLRLELWDHDKFTPADLLGLVDISIFDFLANEGVDAKTEQWLDLIDERGLDRGRVLVELWFEQDDQELQPKAGIFDLYNVGAIEAGMKSTKKIVEGVQAVEKTLKRRIEAMVSVDKKKVAKQKISNRRNLRKDLIRQLNTQQTKLSNFVKSRDALAKAVNTIDGAKSKIDSALKPIILGKKLAKSKMIETRDAKLRKFDQQRKRLDILSNCGSLHVVVLRAEGLIDMDKSIQSLIIPELLNNAKKKFKLFKSDKKKLAKEQKLKDKAMIKAKTNILTRDETGLKRLIAFYKVKSKLKKELKKQREDEKREEFLESLDDDLRDKMLQIEAQVNRMSAVKKLLYKKFVHIEKPKDVKPLPLWIDRLVYILAIVYCAFSGLYIWLFSMLKGKNMADAWLSSLITAQVIGAIINKPLASFIQGSVLPIIAQYYLKLQALDVSRIKALLNDKAGEELGLTSVFAARKAADKMLKNSKALQNLRLKRKKEADRLAAMRHKEWHREASAFPATTSQELIQQQSSTNIFTPGDDVSSSDNIDDPFSRLVMRKYIQVLNGLEIVETASKDMDESLLNEIINRNNKTTSINGSGTTTTSSMLDQEDGDYRNANKNNQDRVKKANIEEVQLIMSPLSSGISANDRLLEMEKMIEAQLNSVMENAKIEENNASKSFELKEQENMNHQEKLQRSKGDQFWGLEEDESISERKRRNQARKQALIAKQREEDAKRARVEAVREQEKLNRDKAIGFEELKSMMHEEKYQCSRGDTFWGIDVHKRAQVMSSSIGADWSNIKKDRLIRAKKMVKSRLKEREKNARRPDSDTTPVEDTSIGDDL